MSMDIRFHSEDEWFISPVIDLSVFLDKCLSMEAEFSEVAMSSSSQFDTLGENEEELATNEIAQRLAELTNCTTDLAKAIITNDLSLDNLRGNDGRTEYDDDATTFEEGNSLEKVPEECQLVTIQTAKKRQQQTTNYNRKSFFLQDGKYYRYDYGISLKRNFLNSILADTEKDFIITCSMPLPNNKVIGSEDPTRPRALRPAVKMVIRGSTTLLDFRRRLICPCDMHVDLEKGKWLEPPDINNKAHLLLYPSSFIFIHDTFYIDPDDKETIDISEPIRAFMAKDKASFGETKVQTIDGICFKDLKLRLGQPYVMVHSGECEHLMIFHDLRMLSAFDEQDITRYPLVAFEKGGDLICIGCKKYPAAMAVESCDLLPQSPGFLCKTCFKEFLFDSNGDPITEFVANHYYPSNKLII
ncbi:unnamed protein product, partial [Mesorhabditis belari]|uniref:snRNA-activating protein complex subunit 3 n=1 Tax=Mesorhabditis belari TaxID=2138241 RepID=A0AAF3EP41_9BILA